MATRKTKKADLDAQRQRIIDELGPLSLEIAALREKEKRYNALRATVAAWAYSADPKEPVVFDGAEWQATVSAQGNQRVVTNWPAVAKAVGADKFFTVCSVPLGVLDKLLTDEQKAKLIAEERTGPRTVKMYRRVTLTTAAEAKAA